MAKAAKHQVRHVMEQLTSVPWGIDEAKLSDITELLELRARGEQFTADEIRDRIGGAIEGRAMDAIDDESEPYALTQDGVAVIPLYGVMSPRVNLMSQISGGTSTPLFTQAVRAAAADPNVRAIVLDVDSPGGIMQGTEEAAQAVRAAREQKPTITVATNEMASAGYYVGSGASEIVASPSSMIGSIGVYTIHMDRSRAYESAGVKPSIIRAGQFKTDGNAMEPLGDQARATIQERVDAAYNMMVGSIAQNRGVSAEVIRETYGKGKVFYAADAVKLGIADRIGTLEDVLAELGAKLRSAAASDRPASFISKEKGEMDKILQAMIEAGLVNADATQAHAEAVLGGWYAGRGSSRPASDEQVVADLKGHKLKSNAGTTATVVPLKGTLMQTAALGTMERVAGTIDPQATARAERDRITQIQTRGQILGIDPELIQAAVDNSTSLAAFLESATANLAAKQTPVGKLQTGAASLDKFHDAAVESLGRRAGLAIEGQASAGARELQHCSLTELAVEGFRIRGARNIHVDRDTIAKAALGDQNSLSILGLDGFQTPGDFPNVLSAMARKALDTAPPYQSTTYRNWAHKRPSVPDFKPATLVRVGEFGEMPLHMDGDDFEQSKTSEESSWIQVDSYGDEFGLTPKMMIDDDLGAFMSALDDKQEAHDQTLNRLCVNLLVGNVACADSVALFHSVTHGNDRAAGNAPSTTELAAMRLLLRKQTGVSAKRKLNFNLAGLLIPEELETVTQQLLEATLTINATTENATPLFKGKVAYWVEPMLADYSAVKYYGFAPKDLARSIVYAHQTGFENMKTSNYYNPKNNCRTFQFEGRFAAAINTWRGIVRNAGTGA
jgi:signal peptide peptidase SppA